MPPVPFRHLSKNASDFIFKPHKDLVQTVCASIWRFVFLKTGLGTYFRLVYAKGLLGNKI